MAILSQASALLKKFARAYRTHRARARFPNVPEKLMIFVRDHMAEYKKTGDRNLLYIEAAGGVIRQYLNKGFFDSEVDPFLGATTVNTQGDLWFGYPLRVILIGETLFLLRSCKGFPEICRRLKTRSLRPAYYEMLATKMFFRAGFEIDMLPEVGRRGSDFDFTAIHDDLIINVEVTALDEKEFHEKTAINALGVKRKQLPKTRPAVIFCVIPSQWETSIPDINGWVESVATKFLRGTRRVNELVFQIERHVDTAGDRSRGYFTLTAKRFSNLDPYFGCNLDFVFSRADSVPSLDDLRNAARNPKVMSALATKMRTSEFYQWVDTLVP